MSRVTVYTPAAESAIRSDMDCLVETRWLQPFDNIKTSTVAAVCVGAGPVFLLTTLLTNLLTLDQMYEGNISFCSLSPDALPKNC